MEMLSGYSSTMSERRRGLPTVSAFRMFRCPHLKKEEVSKRKREKERERESESGGKRGRSSLPLVLCLFTSTKEED